MSAADLLARTDPELWDAISLENRRQEDHVELIASENYVSPAVLAAQGSSLTNKYAEGQSIAENGLCGRSHPGSK